jgi:tRNA (guanosine-2'-O-)-methyltransferase
MADAGIAIPMSGFADSFNISVGAAITLYEARRQRERRFGSNGDLSESDLARMRAVWYLKSVRESDLVVGRGLAERHGPAGTV